VPFIFSWPNEINSDVKIDNAIHHFDIFSTIASAADVNISNLNLDGVNLLPFIKKKTLDKPHKTLFWRSGNHQAVLHENWKYIVSKKENFRWLFDTSNDPLEKDNLIKSYPEIELLMKRLLAEHNSKQSEPLFPSVFEMPILIDKFDGQEFEKGDEYIYWSN